MYKFRTMFLNTEIVEKAKLQNQKIKITRFGKILRKYSLDELPQLICVFIGSMSLVGPRPALLDQVELINKRTKFGISSLKPGITGHAQVNGRDLISDDKKLELEIEYLKKKNLFFDLMIILRTIKVVINNKDILH